MTARYVPFATKLRQYRHLAKRLDEMLKNGSFQLLSSARQKTLLLKLRRRLQNIRCLLPTARWKECLAGIGLLMATGLANPLDAQTFAPGVGSPFGIEANSTYGYPAFADLDGDGDQDMLVAEYDYYGSVINYFENTGTPQSPQFSFFTVVVNPFGINLQGPIVNPLIADFDSDGDFDIMAGDPYTGAIVFLENTGTATAPDFALPTTNPFGLSPASNVNFLTTADLDNDGDLDLLSGGFYGFFHYYQNTGTAAAPAFSAPVANPFGISSQGYITVPNLADYDSDGDMDLLFMEYAPYLGSTIFYSENIGTADVPDFATPFDAPFGITSSGFYVSLPISTDIDSDGDVDVFINDYFGSLIYYYENLNINVNVAPTAANGVVILEEDEPYFFQAADFNFMDANGNDQLEAVEITSLPSAGTLSFNNSPVTVGQVISSFGLPGLAFEGAPNGNGNPYDIFGFKVYDGELWSVEDYVMQLAVTPVNDFPFTDNASVLGVQSMTLTFSENNFPFNDIDGDALAAIRIPQTVDKGILALNGSPVSANQEIPIADLDQLTFTPVLGETGAPYTQFQFQVSDGIVFSPQVGLMTINIETAGAADLQKLDAELMLSPNPVSSVLNINIKAGHPLDNPQLKVYNATGMELLRKDWIGFHETMNGQLDVSTLAPGFYWAKIESEGKAVTVKFVKQ